MAYPDGVSNLNKEPDAGVSVPLDLLHQEDGVPLAKLLGRLGRTAVDPNLEAALVELGALDRGSDGALTVQSDFLDPAGQLPDANRDEILSLWRSHGVTLPFSRALGSCSYAAWMAAGCTASSTTTASSVVSGANGHLSICMPA